MNLFVDENIAFAKEAFSGFGNLKLVNGRSITRNKIKDSDVLIVRSITNVDEELLQDTNVKFIGTATIGIDHIDLQYLKDNKIAFADAKGSNADSVAEYVFSALLKVASEENISLKGKTIGVVGIGNIGSRIVKFAESLGMRVLINDPPLERKGIGQNYVTLDEILVADVITFHVPLTLEGIDKTFHLINNDNVKKIKTGAIVINTSRGPVIDNYVLLRESIKQSYCLILDVWEGEPFINTILLEKTKVGTAHIAGYSLEGKIDGTRIIYNSLCKNYNIKPTWKPELPGIEHKELMIPNGKTDEERLYRLFSSIYNLENDDYTLRKITKLKLSERAEYFDQLRKEYPVRREFNNYTVLLNDKERHFKSILECFRFRVKEK